MKKFSKYNFFVDNTTNVLLHNIANEQTLVLDTSIAKLIQKYIENIDELRTIHPTLFNTLLEREMILDKATDEVANIITKWEKAENSKSNYSITIIPTMACNLNCWYCYEEHKAGEVLKEPTLDKIKRYILSIITNQDLQNFNIDFFGGEPLICYTNVVKPLMEFIKENCTKYGIIYSAHFTTNAVLITPQMVEELLNYTHNIAFQITLDGNKYMHNRVRSTKNGMPTYDVIVNNVFLLLKKRIFVTIRVNFTKDNIDSVVDIIDTFKRLDKEEKAFIIFDFQQVWQDKQNVEVVERVEKIALNFKEQGLNVMWNTLYSKYRCYAEYSNKVVINHNGDVFKCTARNFSSSQREGILTDNGEILWNSKFFKRMDLKNGFNVCKQCEIFPICFGGCSQLKLEASSENTCLKGWTKKEKENFVEKRLKQKLIVRK